MNTHTSVSSTATAQHTPGPWHVATYGEGSASFYAVKRGSATICRVVEVDPMLDRTGDANARLIAAAPDLLAALKTVTEHLRITCNEYRRFANEHGVDAIHPLDDPILSDARAAIQRATA